MTAKSKVISLSGSSTHRVHTRLIQSEFRTDERSCRQPTTQLIERRLLIVIVFLLLSTQAIKYIEIAEIRTWNDLKEENLLHLTTFFHIQQLSSSSDLNPEIWKFSLWILSKSWMASILQLQHVQRVKMWNLKMSSASIRQYVLHEQMHLTMFDINITLISCLYSRILPIFCVDSPAAVYSIEAQHKNWETLSFVFCHLRSPLFLRLFTLDSRLYRENWYVLAASKASMLHSFYILTISSPETTPLQGEG